MTSARQRLVRAFGRPLPGLVLAVVYAWWATGLETFTAASTVAVVGGGAVAVGVGTGQRHRGHGEGAGRTGRDRPRHGPARKPGLAVWLVLLSALAALQMAMYTRGPREDYPTISSIINSLLDTHGARTVAHAAWLVGAVRLGRLPGRSRKSEEGAHNLSGPAAEGQP